MNEIMNKILFWAWYLFFMLKKLPVILYLVIYSELLFLKKFFIFFFKDGSR